MNINTITMDPEAARAAFQEYQAAVRLRHNDEDAEIAKAYKELAKGRSIINLLECLQMAGLDENSYPKLAIARADAKIVYFTWSGDRVGNECFFQLDNRYLSDSHTRRKIRIPTGIFPATNEERPRYARGVTATMPIVPPALRPRDSLQNYYILFEPVWKSVPNPDPILLKRLSRYTFAVLAQWDLTPVELMLLRGRGEGN